MSGTVRETGYPVDMAKMIFARPHMLLRACSAAILIVSLVILFLMLRIPLASVDAEMGASGKTELVGDGRRVIIPADSIVRFRALNGATEVRLEAGLLPGVAEPRGSANENRHYWAGRDRLAALLASGPVAVNTGGETLIARTRSRTISDLTIGFWLSMIAGAVSALAGLWVWVLRQRDWAPAMFALSGVGLFVGCFTTAINISPGLGMSGRIDQTMMIVNYISGVVCAGALVALFARFPLPLLRAKWLWLIGVINAAAGAVVAFDAVPNAVDVAILIVLADSVGIIALLAVQAWRSREHPEHRSGLTPIAIGSGVSILLFCVLSMLGQVGGGKPLVQPDMTAPLLLLIYLGMGMAIMRARLFALGRWAASLLLSACAILFFLLLDALLLSSLTQQRDLALFMSAVLSVTVYLPLRGWMLRHAERLRDLQASGLLQCASDVALALTPTAASKAWHDAIHAMFDPLEMEPTPFGGEMPIIYEGGQTLYVPTAGGEAGVMLRYPGGGARIFGSADVETATRFGGLVRRLIEARDAYLRGVSEERGRIARDLHDDVSARLLTSLHRADTKAMQADVRSAMADIRTIVTGLSGAPQPLHMMLATLRHETQMRLEAAGIQLLWPVPISSEEDHLLPYRLYRHLVSIVREAVTNIIRHSEAGQAEVRVSMVNGEIALDIIDDGRGVQDDISLGNGLLNARRRTEEVGGRFALISEERGTCLSVVVPLAWPEELELHP